MATEPLDGPSRDLLDALDYVTDRRTASGRPWCPWELGQGLRRLVLSQGPALRGLAHQAVRLARLMEAADPQGMSGFLYRRLPPFWHEGLRGGPDAGSRRR